MKNVGLCSTHVNEWVASAPFRQHVWRHLVAKTSLSSSPYMCYHVLFHAEWRITAYSGWIVTSDRLIFFPLLFSLQTGNVHHCSLCFLLFNSSLYSLNFLFHFFFIYRSFFLFNLVLQLQFLICFFFYFKSLFF